MSMFIFVLVLVIPLLLPLSLLLLSEMHPNTPLSEVLGR